MLKVAILGGSGYTGGELLRLLQNHSQVEITAVTSERFAGKSISDVFPHMYPAKDLTFEALNLRKLAGKAELFFLCLPHKKSQEVVAHLHKANKKVIDLSADYRLKSPEVYEEWYKTSHKFPELLKTAVYGLSELYRKKIEKARIIANPGCYPTCIILGLAPLMGEGIIDVIDTDCIIADSKSGISGAGRNPELSYMFSEANESVKAYAVMTHRHTPEIEQELSSISKRRITITFTPHLIPMDRGILSTIYVPLKKNLKLVQAWQLYHNFYLHEPFIRVLKNGTYPNTKSVKGTNFCDIAIFYNQRKNSLIIVTAIDNLLKGGAGQAVQNMNIMYGFDETVGLKTIPAYP
ncbi:MAG: N-acetyl-gamma-glutamyl-phosphate reductase [Nitrospirae bacterium]|nr:N-acetyl-gamma-glutamyl-phosphate reductase [Nitrospirota bacterium]